MSKFKVGDLVLRLSDGFSVILEGNKEYPLCIKGTTYTADGKRWHDDIYPSLLTLDEAAKLNYFPPNKKVKKTVTVYVNVYSEGVKYHATEVDAISNADTRAIAVAVPCVGEYEVEE